MSGDRIAEIRNTSTLHARLPDTQHCTLSTHLLFAKSLSKNQNVCEAVPFVHQLIGYETSPGTSMNTVGKLYPGTNTKRTFLQCLHFYRHASHIHSHNSLLLYSCQNGLGYKQTVSIYGSSRDLPASALPRSTLEPTNSPVQWVQGTSHWE